MRKSASIVLRCRATLLVSLLAASPFLVSKARALNPARSLNQYVQTIWTREQGVPAGLERMVQDRDGFLWAAARDGIFRFDGISFEKVEVQSKFATSHTRAMAAMRDGSVWFGHDDGGIEVYRKGVFRDVPFNTVDPITHIVETRDGTVWATDGSPNSPLGRFDGKRLVKVNAALGLPNGSVASIVPARDGSLWVSIFNNKSVFRLPPGAHRFKPISMPVGGVPKLSQDHQGRMWISDDLGSRVIWASGTIVSDAKTFPTPPLKRGAQPHWDQDGNLWMLPTRDKIVRLSNPFRTARASYEVPPATVDTYSVSNFQSFIEDREGNLWVISASSLQRYSNSVVVDEPALVNVPPVGDVVTSTSDGTVYVGEHDAVYRIEPYRNPVPILTKMGDPQIICAAKDQSVVVGFENRLVRVMGSKTEDLSFPDITGTQFYDCAFDESGSLWVTVTHKGLYKLEGTKWSSETLKPSTEDGGYFNLSAGPTGGVVANRGSGKLSILKPSQQLDFPLGFTTTIGRLKIFSLAAQRLWLGGSQGLGYLEGATVKLPSARQDIRLRELDALLDTPGGETWMKGPRGVYRAATRDLVASLRNGAAPLRLLVLDGDDGADEGHIVDSHLNIARGGDGRLWFSGPLGTRWLDPRTLTHNAVPPGVTVSQVIADGTRYLDPAELRLPAGTASLEIQFAALSLTKPTRTVAYYRLKGVDSAWINAGKRRSAFYTNLGPGEYQFETKAVNGDGVWSNQVARLTIKIPPTFLQSLWFKFILSLLVAALLGLLIRMRSLQVARQTRLQMQARMSERERIAGDLHDTLLQGFQGMILRFQALLPEAGNRAAFERTLDQAQGQLEEGRHGLYQLRTADLRSDLVKDLTELGEELSRDSGIAFRVVRQGAERNLEPLAGIEVERIVVEAVRNAFSHSHARAISATMTYEERLFQVDVEDDGDGIPKSFLEDNRGNEHFGLSVMRERAERLRAHLTLQSAPGKGTRVTLKLSARLAYAKQRSAPWWRAKTMFSYFRSLRSVRSET